MGEQQPRLTPETRKSLRHHQMRIRTVAVSFAAAVSSARKDMDAAEADIDNLIETWRAWSLGMLEQYATEARALGTPSAPDEAEAVRLIDDELVEAYRLVNET